MSPNNIYKFWYISSSKYLHDSMVELINVATFYKMLVDGESV